MDAIVNHPIEQKRDEVIAAFVKQCGAEGTLTASERVELRRMSRGCAAKDSVRETGLSPETIRARRKRIYRKLGVEGHVALQQELLAIAVKMLSPKVEETAQPAGV